MPRAPRYRNYVFTLQSSSSTEASFAFAPADLPMHPAEAFVVWQHERAARDHLQGYIELQSPQPLTSLQSWLTG